MQDHVGGERIGRDRSLEAFDRPLSDLPISCNAKPTWRAPRRSSDCRRRFSRWRRPPLGGGGVKGGPRQERRGSARQAAPLPWRPSAMATHQGRVVKRTGDRLDCRISQRGRTPSAVRSRCKTA
jgi:hypothetical protein